MTATIRPFARVGEGAQPPYLHRDYGSTVKRAPQHAPIRIDHTLTEVTGPIFTDGWAGADAADLTRQHHGEPLGERIIVAGRVLDEDKQRRFQEFAARTVAMQFLGALRPPGRSARCAAGREFSRAGESLHRTRTEDFRFVTIKPGAYPWRNHLQAWRPAHIHFAFSAQPSRPG